MNSTRQLLSTVHCSHKCLNVNVCGTFNSEVCTCRGGDLMVKKNDKIVKDQDIKGKMAGEGQVDHQRTLLSIGRT